MVTELYSKPVLVLEEESLFYEVLVDRNLVPCLDALPCGHRPTWVGIYETAKHIRGPQSAQAVYLCVKLSLLGDETNDFSFSCFQMLCLAYFHFLTSDSSWVWRAGTPACVKPLRSTGCFSFPVRAHCIMVFKAAPREPVRAGPFKFTEESSEKQVLKSRCCSIRVLPSFEKQDCTNRCVGIEGKQVYKLNKRTGAGGASSSSVCSWSFSASQCGPLRRCGI